MNERVTRFLIDLYCRQHGAQFAEYGVLIVVGVVAAAAGVATFGSEVATFFAGLFDDMTVSPNLVP